jgi:hypothetical protein
MLTKLRTLMQTRHGPDRYVLSIFFDTMPSAPGAGVREDDRAVLDDVFVE